MSTGDKIDDMEAHIEKLELELIRLRTKMEEHQEAVRDIDSKLDSILNEMSRYKGFQVLVQHNKALAVQLSQDRQLQ